MKKIFILLTLLLGAFSTGVQAQSGKVTGIVSDSSGSPIVGASVVEKGEASNGTTTNASGRFSLTLRGNSRTLVVSFVGHEQQEVRVGNTNTVDVALRNATGDLADVVVVGYGRQRKITTTGSISTITGAELRNNPASSVQNTLAGRLPGFFSQQSSGRPGADGATFFIRGVSSYNSGVNSPLIIVDDIEVTYDQFSLIDANEIENLSILKDASTTAIYGVRGANGVVLVTTRRGKLGRPAITFRGETSLQQPTVFPKFLDAYESAVLFNKSREHDGLPLQFTDDDLQKFKDGSSPYTHPNVDWRKILFRNFSRQHRGNFDISGGTEKIKYFISAGYLQQDGMVNDFGSRIGINSNFYHKRYNYRSNMDMRLTRTTDLRVDLVGNITETNTPRANSPNGWDDVFADYGSFQTLAPWAYPVYNPNGSFGYSQWSKQNSVYDVNNIVGRLTYSGYSRDFDNSMSLVAEINQKLDFLTRGLSVKGRLAYTSNHNNANVSMTGAEFPSFIYDPVTNVYEPRSPNIYRVRRLVRSSANGSTARLLQKQIYLNYDRMFGGKHNVNGLVLLNELSDTRAGSAIYNFIPQNFRGITGRLRYDYRQKYLFEVNGAYNGSDRFAEGNRFGFFPSAAVGWNISEEPFFKKNIGFINRMKFRGSYGLVGNDKIGSFAYYYEQNYTQTNNVVFFGNPNPNNGNGVYEGTLGNLEVSWEKEKKLDVGVEMGLFKNALAINLTYFDFNRYDILTDRSGRSDPRFGSVSLVFGQSLPPVNLGRVNNRGVEVEIAYNNKIGKDWNYSVRGSYSYARNKILFADEPSYQYDYQSYTGHSINTQRVYTWIGFYDAAAVADPKVPKPTIAVQPGDLRYADLNEDGVIDGFDTKVQGDPNIPNTTAGLQLAVRYKGFSIGVFFQGSSNFNVRGVAEAISPMVSNFRPIHRLTWTPELGDKARFPVLSSRAGISSARGYPSTFWLIPGDFIRMKTAEISYSLPQAWVKSIGLQNVRVFSNGYNLFTWTKLSKLYELDPEINQGSNGSNGTDRTNYPPQRTFNFGLSVTF